MRLFISWSGLLSHKIALELRDWFRLTFPTIEPFVSSEDIRKGGQWSTVLSGSISAADRGIVCVTKANFEKPWLQFETGALQNSNDAAIVYTLLVDSVRPEHLSGNPLSLFQHTRFERDDFFKLVEAINTDIASGSRSSEDLKKIFSQSWPTLKAKRDELLGASLYTQNVIFLQDLARETSVIAGQSFENVIFKGPAIIAFLENCSISECTFSGSEKEGWDSILWERNEALPFIGAVGMSRCHIHNCVFDEIGVTGSHAFLDALRNSINWGEKPE